MTKLLVIEDEAILRAEVVEWLTLEGYEVLCAEDGQAGVEVAFRNLPDLIICDITMPQLDGFGVLLELHANASTADIPFIFMTARAAHEDIRKGMDLGADDYVTKPFTHAELLRAVHTRLEKKAFHDQRQQQKLSLWQQAFEQEREQHLLKAKLVAMFSHDFRKQLTVILASNTLLRDYHERLTAQRRLEHMNGIETAVNQLLQMLDDMHVVSQLETGHLVSEPQPLNIEQFVESIVQEFQTSTHDSHQLRFDSHFSGTALADTRLLRQIVVNLISNAIKYSPPGSEVYIKLDSWEGQYSISVKDQGIGIPEADQKQLFEAFHRASNVGSTAGTGLAIVKQAVDLQGGSISLESQVGEGTTVTVTLPIQQV